MPERLGVILNIIRWGCFVLGLFIIGILLVFAVGEGGPPMFTVSLESLMTWSLLVWCLGISVSFRWLGAGSTLGLSGISAFNVLGYLRGGSLSAGPIFLLMWIPPLLFFGVWIVGKVAGKRELQT